MSEERTEAPTPKRRQDSRRRGDVARSTEINLVVTLAVGFLVLQWYGPALIDGLLTVLRGHFLAVATTEITLDGLAGPTSRLTLIGLGLLAPLLGATLLAGLAADLGQVGFLWSPQALSFKVSHLNPLNGAKRLFAKHTLFMFGKSLAQLTVLTVVAGIVIRDVVLALLEAGPAETGAAAGLIGAGMIEVALKVIGAFIPLAFIDLVYQRRELLGKLRMTKQEVKREFKENEGDPLLRSLLRQRQRQIAGGRMMQSVPRADVIVTNPTHYAVAIAYNAEQMSAPVVLAKGQNLIAERIKEIGRQHGVPIVENKPVAQMLYRTVDVGGAIPADLYRAVAEILAFIYQVRTRRGPATDREAAPLGASR